MATIGELMTQVQGVNAPNSQNDTLDAWLRSPAGQQAIQQAIAQSQAQYVGGEGGSGMYAQTAPINVQTPYGMSQLLANGSGGYQIIGGDKQWFGDRAERPTFSVDAGGNITGNGFNETRGGGVSGTNNQLAAFLALAAGGSAYGLAGGAGAGAGGGGTLATLEAATPAGAGYYGAAGGAAAGAAGSAAGSGVGSALGNAAGSAVGGAAGGIGDAIGSAAGIGTIASLLAAYQQSQAADRAAQYQLEGTKLGIDEIRRQFDTAQANQRPWLDAGTRQLANLEGQLPTLTKAYTGADLMSDPGYQFGMKQGQDAVTAKMKSIGMGASGATLKDLMRFGQDYAGTKYNEGFNRDQVNKQSIYNMLAGISGTGQVAGNQLATQGANAGQNVASLIGRGANAQAAGTVGSANAWTNAAQNIGDLWSNQNMQNMYSNLWGRR